MKKVKLPQICWARVNKWLKALTPRQMLALVLTAGILSLLLGFALGAFLATRQQPSGGESSTPSTSTPQSVTRTGVVRQFKDSQHEGIDFYLEEGDGTKVLLKSSEIDLDFFEGTAVTAEGMMTPTADDSAEVLQVEKIWIKKY